MFGRRNEAVNHQQVDVGCGCDWSQFHRHTGADPTSAPHTCRFDLAQPLPDQVMIDGS